MYLYVRFAGSLHKNTITCFQNKIHEVRRSGDFEHRPRCRDLKLLYNYSLQWGRCADLFTWKSGFVRCIFPHFWQNTANIKCVRISITDRLSTKYRCIDQAKSTNNVHNFQVFTLFAHTRYAGTWIVCPACTVISSRARPDLVDLWLPCRISEPEIQGRFPDGHLL